jgi:MHS family alpha-ketoglutarate permease-like MFS transporter
MLVFARMLQGLSVGGEYGASATYLSEMAGRKRRGYYASFQYVTLIGGQLTALGVLLLLQAVLDETALEAWGWRIPFAIGGALAIVVFRIRRGLLETESFRNVNGADRSSGAALFRDHPREAWTVMALTAGGTLAFYAYTTYMQKFLVNTAGFGRGTATQVMTAALLLYACMQPVAGALSDRVGRKPLLVGFGVLGVLGTAPLFLALERVQSPLLAFALVSAALIALSGYTAISGVLKAEMFPAHIRTLGVALPYAIANTIFGGTAEYLALWLKDQGVERWFYGYVTAMIAVSLVAYLRMPDTKATSRIAED